MSVGNRLKKARKAKGLTLDDIKNKSKIKKNYLEALENDNYKKLPGEVYTKVYIRGYAKIVGLDPQEILSEYENEKNKDRKIDEKDKKAEKKNKVKGAQLLNKDGILKALLGIILVLILILLSYNLFLRPDQNQNNAANNEQTVEVAQQNETNRGNSADDEAVSESSVNSDNENKNSQDQSVNESINNNSDEQTNNELDIDNETQNNSTGQNNDEENTNQVEEEEQQPLIEDETKELTILAKEKSWLQVTVDGELKFQGFINEDETMTHNGTESIRLKIGNGIAVQVEYEGKVEGPFGKRGEVIIKEFDLD